MITILLVLTKLPCIDIALSIIIIIYFKTWKGVKELCFEILMRVGTGSKHEDCYGTFKKLVTSSECSKYVDLT